MPEMVGESATLRLALMQRTRLVELALIFYKGVKESSGSDVSLTHLWKISYGTHSLNACLEIADSPTISLIEFMARIMIIR